tara:strand:- start:320 stop:952 length:633 start_codon:yes stop_codon:yes gene_type:complete
MTTTHEDGKVHISMLAALTEEVVAFDKLIGTDEDTLKTKNFFPRDLREYALNPWKIGKFTISKAQVLATSIANPVILLPSLGLNKFYEFSPMFANMFINVVTDPANPFVCGAGDDLKLGWWNTVVGAFWNNAPFKSLDQSQITNPTTQMVRWAPFGVGTMSTVSQWTDTVPTSQSTAVALGPRLSGAPGWIAGDGYWQVELMYRESEMLV